MCGDADCDCMEVIRWRKQCEQYDKVERMSCGKGWLCGEGYWMDRMIVWKGCFCGQDDCVERVFLWTGWLCEKSVFVDRMIVWKGCFCGQDGCVKREFLWTG